MRIQLTDIEQAIRSNFLLQEGQENGGKPLTSSWYYESHSYSTARMVFLAMALSCHFKPEEICDHIQMTITEFNALRKKYREMYSEGQKKYNAIRAGELSYSKDVTNCLDLRIYRKTMLVTNYLRTVHHKAIHYI